MKTFVFVLAALALAAAETYTDRYDNINLKEIMGNDRLLTGYHKCMMDEGPCTAEGTELKSHIKEAMENNCAKCTEAQQSGTRTMIRHLINKQPAMWASLRGKYDPKNVYATKYEKELKELSN